MMTTQIILQTRPTGKPTLHNFHFREVAIPALQNDEVLLKGLYFSVDPYMRGRMNDSKSYIPPFKLDEAITGGAIAEIMESKSENLKVGDLILGMLPWQKTSVCSDKQLQKIDKSFSHPSYYLGVLGMPGLTAYFGLLDIGKPRAGETVVISGAAGAVGIIVGQIAKLMGCNVIGIAGSNEKVKEMVDTFGFKEVINYKTTTDLMAAIVGTCPNGVDIYFDNVGGEISDAVIANLNMKARIVLCGQIALYNKTDIAMGPRLQPSLLTKSILMQGFIVSDYKERFAEATEKLKLWLDEGKLVYKETIVKGFEKLPNAFIGLFEGKNIGKMIVEA